MRAIQRFTASGVYDHLRMDLAFNEELTFLFGLNGSGKTTALKLMMAMLEPSLEPLVRIPFRELELVGETHKHSNVSVAATKGESTGLELRCSIVPDEVFSLGGEGLEGLDLGEVQMRESRSNPVLRAIADLAPPIFLGIDRRFKTPRTPPQRHRVPTSRQIAHEFQRERSLDDPAFDPGLGEVAFVIEDFASNLRRRQAGIDERFRQEIILDAFTYVDPQLHGFTLEPSEEMFKAFREKSSAIRQALADLNLDSDESERRSDHFFMTIEEVMSTIRKLSGQRDKEGELPKELNEAVTTWFMNQPQVDRIDRLFDATNKYREAVSYTH